LLLPPRASLDQIDSPLSSTLPSRFSLLGVFDFSALIATAPRNDYLFEMRARCYEALAKHDLAQADRAEAD
jgi:hypothetical protein